MVNVLQTIEARLTLIFLGCFMAGCVLVGDRVSLSVWFFTEILLLFLAWRGTSAIPLSVVGVLGIVWKATLSTTVTKSVLWSAVRIGPAQSWAAQLLIYWFLANSLVFLLGFTTQFLRQTGKTQRQIFILMMLIPNLGFLCSQVIRVVL